MWLQRANDGTTDYPAAQYVILSLYLLLLLGLVVAARLIALRRNEQNEAEHFLAGRSLGPITLGFSVCASMFSGYTVVGIPAEAYTAGFSAWRDPCLAQQLVLLLEWRLRHAVQPGGRLRLPATAGADGRRRGAAALAPEGRQS